MRYSRGGHHAISKFFGLRWARCTQRDAGGCYCQPGTVLVFLTASLSSAGLPRISASMAYSSPIHSVLQSSYRWGCGRGRRGFSGGHVPYTPLRLCCRLRKAHCSHRTHRPEGCRCIRPGAVGDEHLCDQVSAGGSSEPALRSSHTYTHNRAVRVLPLPGSCTSMSSVCTFPGISRSQSGPTQLHTLPAVYLRLPVVRRMFCELRRDDARQQPGVRVAALNGF